MTTKVRITTAMVAFTLAHCTMHAIAFAQTNAIADGNWSDSTTWDNNEPSTTSSAFINGGHTVTIDQSGETTNLLDAGTIAGETGNVVISGGDLTISHASDPGAFPSSIRLGQVTGSTGNLTMSGGTVSINGNVGSGFAIADLLVGDNGTGTMTMTDGTFNAADEVFVGLGGTSKGTLNVSGGTLNIAGRNLLVAFFGGATAEVNLSGTGIINVDEFLFSSFNDATTSTINQTGGTLNVGAALVHGRRGNATYNHSGGVATVTTLQNNGDFVVGDGGPNNVYNISDAAVANAGRHFLVGVFGDAQGTVNQSGGTVNVGDLLRVGIDGVGNWNQTGGTVNVVGSAFLGDFDSSSGSYKISGGTLDIAGNLSVGGALASNAAPDRVEPDATNGPQGQALDANGTLIVSGSAATIDVGGNFLANPSDKSAFRRDPIELDGDNSATLVFELFDGSGTSLIDVAGVADLDGAVIDIDLMGGYTPTFGQTFDLIAASSFGATGSGTTQNVGNGKGFSLAAEDIGVFRLDIVSGVGGELFRATVVPEPALSVLLGSMALALFGVRGIRKR